MFKKLTILSIIMALSLAFTACGKDDSKAKTAGSEKVSQVEQTTKSEETEATTEAKPAEKITIEVGGPPAPPSFPILRMIEAQSMGENVELKFNKWDSIDALMAMANDEKVGFIGVPLNSAVAMYNKGLDVRLMNINTWSVMGVLTTDPSIEKWEDLKDKTIYVPMKSSPVDYMTQTFMKEHGIIPGENVEVIYTQLPEAAQLMISGKASTIVTIEPQKTMVMSKKEDAQAVFNYKEEWQKLSGLDTDLPNAGLIGKGKFISEQPEVAALFQEKYEEALKWVLENPEEAGQLAEKYLEMNAGLVAKAVPNMALDFKAAADSQTELEKYYQILFDFDKASIGGKLPDEAFYYQK